MLRQWRDFWLGEIARNPFVTGVIICFVVSTGLNGWTGYRISNGSLAVMAVLVAIALFTTYCGSKGFVTPGARGWVMVLCLPFGLAIDQISQLRTYGINFADGQVARDLQADGLDTLREKLGQQREARKALGTVRAVNSIVAERVLECGIVSKRYPDGNGPNCTKLKAEEGAARKAQALDDEIAETMAAIEDRPPVAGGGADYEVAAGVATAFKTVVAKNLFSEKKVDPITGEQVEFVFLLFVSGTVGILANLGFWLTGVRFDREEAVIVDAGAGATPQLEGPPPRPQLPRGSVQAPRPANDPRPLQHQASMPGMPNQTFNIHAAGGAERPLPPRVAARLNAGAG